MERSQRKALKLIDSTLVALRVEPASMESHKVPSLVTSPPKKQDMMRRRQQLPPQQRNELNADKFLVFKLSLT